MAEVREPSPSVVGSPPPARLQESAEARDLVAPKLSDFDTKFVKLVGSKSYRCLPRPVPVVEFMPKKQMELSTLSSRSRTRKRLSDALKAATLMDHDPKSPHSTRPYAMPTIPYTPDDIIRLNHPTEGFLCPLEANAFGIQFLEFEIRDYDTKAKYFHIGGNVPNPTPLPARPFSSSPDDLRTISYDLPMSVLNCSFISTKLIFKVGDQPVENFRMIERHYFREHLLKSFDFAFSFCIPGSQNEWECIYDVPQLDVSLLDSIVQHPYETVSDSFYFVGNSLIMHNKAYYRYYIPATLESKVLESKSLDSKRSLDVDTQPSTRSIESSASLPSRLTSSDSKRGESKI